jgi:predicted phosphodiesterase
MATPLTDFECKEAYETKLKLGSSIKASTALGISRGSLDNRLMVGIQRGLFNKPVIRQNLTNEANATLNDPEMVYKRILVISDLHAPYHHKDALAFIKSLKDKYNPDGYIITGDELDYHAISYHDSDPNLPSAGCELNHARTFLHELERLIPDAMVLESNHTSLAYRRARTGGIPKHLITSYRGVMFGDRDIDGDIYYPNDRGRCWKWFPDLILQTPHAPVYFCHGKKTRTETNIMDDKMCFVQGHHHSRYEVVYVSTPNVLLWGMTVGCMIDTKSLAFHYNRLDSKRPLIGCAVIINGLPQLTPMPLDKDGRWTGVTP